MSPEKARKLWKIIQEAGDYLGDQRFTLAHTSYADYLQFVKNQPHKDSLKTLVKLDTKLDYKEINQMVKLLI